MLKHILAFAPLVILTFATAAQAQTYAATKASCGAEPEGGYIGVSAGKLEVGETSYTRISPKRSLSDGWLEAEFSVLAEGEALDDLTLHYQITPDRVKVVIDKTLHEAVRCPS